MFFSANVGTQTFNLFKEIYFENIKHMELRKINATFRQSRIISRSRRQGIASARQRSRMTGKRGQLRVLQSKKR